MTPIIGYLASAIVLISFVMKDIRMLRWVNIVGCGLFIIWGILIGEFPVVLTNGGIVLVNLYYLLLKKAS